MTLDDVKNKLRAGRIFHAYIITGGGAESRLEAGRFIARAAVCTGGAAPCGTCRDCVKALRGVHPDIEVVEREGKEHTVDIMRTLRGRAVVMPNEAPRSVFIIKDADAMNLPAQNAMLKVFEEPPPHAVFVLLADNPQRLLETVRSRCEAVSLTPEEDSAPEELVKLAGDLVSPSGGDMTVARACARVETLGREELLSLLTIMRQVALENAALLDSSRLERVLDAADRADEMIKVNVSALHIAALLQARLMGDADIR